jgi:signal peptidase II
MLRKLNITERVNLRLALYLGVLVILFDHILKFWAWHRLRGRPPNFVLSDFVVIEYAENRGAFLSLGANLSEEFRFWIFVIGVSFVLLFCLGYLWKSLADRWLSLAFGLVIAGGVGNLIDRIIQGFVIDYIHMGFGSIRTGVFNLADVAITGGLLALIYLEYRAEKRRSAKA